MERYKDTVIETDRLILRVPTMDDAQEINTAMNEVWHELQLWMSWANDGQNTMDATCAYLKNAAANGMVPLAAFCKESGKFAVSTGVTLHADGRHETGYWVAKDFLGRGYATEACAASMRFAFEQMGADRMFINYYEGNDKSRRIIEKLGFAKIGVKEKSHARCLDGLLMDEHQYGMSAEQWRQRCP